MWHRYCFGYKNEDKEQVKGIHEPIVSNTLFDQVQILLNSKRTQRNKKTSKKHFFPLRGFISCPYCNGNLTGSFSQGRRAKYRYYHCHTVKCRGRFNADKLDAAYESQLKSLRIAPEVYELFELILQDENILTTQKKHQDEQKIILAKIDKHESLLSKARRLLLTEVIDQDDFMKIKQENTQAVNDLNIQLSDTKANLSVCYEKNRDHA